MKFTQMKNKFVLVYFGIDISYYIWKQNEQKLPEKFLDIILLCAYKSNKGYVYKLNMVLINVPLPLSAETLTSCPLINKTAECKTHFRSAQLHVPLIKSVPSFIMYCLYVNILTAVFTHLMSCSYVMSYYLNMIYGCS